MPASLSLFCLRAAASRAARKAKRTAARYLRAGQPTAMVSTVYATVRRAETARYAFFDAQWEAQRAGLSRMAVLTNSKSYALAA